MPATAHPAAGAMLAQPTVAMPGAPRPAEALPVDALGRPVPLAGEAPRIVSLVPSITELLYELGLGKGVVGRTGFCIHPAPAVRAATKVGGTKDVDLDAVVEYPLLRGSGQRAGEQQQCDQNPECTHDSFTCAGARSPSRAWKNSAPPKPPSRAMKMSGSFWVASL